MSENQHEPSDDPGLSEVNKSTLKSSSGVCKSYSCTGEFCDCSNEDSKHKPPASKMIVSNSSASFKSRSYLKYYCHTHHNNPQVHQIWIENKPDREHWDKKIEFLLAVIGFAVDLGNVWRFPYICYRNGGGAFLIPYTIMLLFGGLPLFYLELALGQYYSSGCLTIWKRICPIMKGLGYAICIIDIYMAMYYNTIIAWAVYYFFVSLKSLSSFTLPWQNCGNEWNTPNCQTLEQRRFQVDSLTNATSLTSVSPAQEYFYKHVLHIDASSGIDSLGPIKPSLAFCLMMVFVVVYFSLWKGIKSSGKAVWVTALLPYFVIFVLLIRGTTLDGADDGIRYYLSPDWEKLKSLNVWIDAATQIFFSLGPGFGTLLALSSYNKFHNNCYRDAIFTSCVNCLTSFVAGFVTFSILGYMAKKLNKDISNVVSDGPGLVFIVYPEAIATMYGSVFFSILFFVMLITLGLDSTFGGLEAMITGLCDEYPKLLRRHREIFVGILIMFLYLCALPTTTYGGNYLITLLDTHGTALSVLFVVFIETIAICWIYGSEKFSLQIKEMLGAKPGIFWRICWISLCPIILGFIAFAAIINKDPLKLGSYEYPKWSTTVGWLITFSSLSCIPIYAIYHVLRTPGEDLPAKLKKSFRPTNERSTTVNDTGVDDVNKLSEQKSNRGKIQVSLNDMSHDNEITYLNEDNNTTCTLGDAV